MKTSVLIGLSRHRIGVDGEGAKFRDWGIEACGVGFLSVF